jgi:hypothetical protein
VIKDYAIKTKIILSVDWLVTCRYPLYIDIVISMIKYWIRLHEDKTNCILKAALDENNKMHNNGQHCWVGLIYLVKDNDPDKEFNPR